jgi:hypothetical protein
MTDIRLQPQYYAPPVSPPPGAAPPPYEVSHKSFPIGAVIVGILTSGLGMLAYWFKPQAEENIVFVDKPTIVEKPVFINKTVEVEKIVYVDKPVIKEKIVEKTVYVDKIIEHDCPLVVPIEYTDPYNGL